MKTIDYFYAAKKLNNFSDADMARALSITTAAVAKAKQREHLSAYNAMRCAEMAGLDIAEAIKAAAIEAEHEEEKRNYMLRKLGGVVASVAFVSVNFFSTPTIAEAAPRLAEQVRGLCIMLNRMLVLLAIAAVGKRGFPGRALEPTAA